MNALKAEGLTIRRISKFNVDQSSSRGDERVTQCVVTSADTYITLAWSDTAVLGSFRFTLSLRVWFNTSLPSRAKNSTISSVSQDVLCAVLVLCYSLYCDICRYIYYTGLE